MHNETKYSLIGMCEIGLVFVSFTFKGGNCRIIPTRKATSNLKIFAGGAEAVCTNGKIAAQGIHFSLSGEKVEFAGATVPVFEKNHAHQH